MYRPESRDSLTLEQKLVPFLACTLAGPFGIFAGGYYALTSPGPYAGTAGALLTAASVHSLWAAREYLNSNTRTHKDALKKAFTSTAIPGIPLALIVGGLFAYVGHDLRSRGDATPLPVLDPHTKIEAKDAFCGEESGERTVTFLGQKYRMTCPGLK